VQAEQSDAEVDDDAQDADEHRRQADPQPYQHPLVAAGPRELLACLSYDAGSRHDEQFLPHHSEGGSPAAHPELRQRAELPLRANRPRPPAKVVAQRPIPSSDSALSYHCERTVPATSESGSTAAHPELRWRAELPLPANGPHHQQKW
jgi:hypothetical protein